MVNNAVGKLPKVMKAVVINEKLSKSLEAATVDGAKGMILLGILLYILARLFILVEIFRSLCFLPPDTWVATWATNIPHIG